MIHRLKLRRLPTDYLIAMMRTVRHVRVRLLNRHTMEPVVDSSTVDEDVRSRLQAKREKDSKPGKKKSLPYCLVNTDTTTLVGEVFAEKAQGAGIDSAELAHYVSSRGQIKILLKTIRMAGLIVYPESRIPGRIQRDPIHFFPEAANIKTKRDAKAKGTVDTVVKATTQESEGKTDDNNNSESKKTLESASTISTTAEHLTKTHNKVARSEQTTQLVT